MVGEDGVSKGLGDKLHGHADQAFRDFHQGYGVVLPPALLWPVALLTVMSYVLFFTGCWFMALALNIGIGPAYLAFCIAVVNIVSLVSFAGVGNPGRRVAFVVRLGAFFANRRPWRMTRCFVSSGPF
jgi:hypothetical protein